MRTKIQDFAVSIAPAAKNDAAVWRNTSGFNDNSDMSSRLSSFLWYYDWRINWLYSQWGEGIKPATWDIELLSGEEQPIKSQKILKDGQILILRNGAMYSITGVRVR